MRIRNLPGTGYDQDYLTRLRLRPSRHVLVALHTKFDSFVKISGTQGFLVRLEQYMMGVSLNTY
jgi:hypothetical protein